MDLSNLKSSLFGYNKLAVSRYVSGLESESNQKIQDLQKASKEAEDTLRAQIEQLRAKHEEEVRKLNEKIEELTEERDLLRRDNDTIADTLLDAEEYAADLRCKADQKAKERDEEHLQILSNQRSEVEKIDTKLHGVLDAISDLLAAASNTLTGHAEELEETGQEIGAEMANYMPAEEAEEEAQELTEEAPEEAQEPAEEAPEEAQELTEEAPEEAQELKEEAPEEVQEPAKDTAEEVQEPAEDTAEEAQEPAEDTAEEAAEDTDQTADQEALEASDEAIEKAAALASDAAEEEESGESVSDRWTQFYTQKKEESVSKFEQAAGEIAGKLQ